MVPLRKSSTKAVLGLLVAVSCVAAVIAQSTLPKNYKLLLDNADVSVLRAHYGPHEKVPVHDHPAFDTVFVYLNDSGVVRIRHTEGTQHAVTDRPPTHAGAFRIAPGRPERHSVENLSDVPSDSVLVQLKKLPAGTISDVFRGPAATPPLLTATSTVYSNPALKIERIICDPGATCTLDLEPSPSVLVAVTPTALLGGSRGQMLTDEQPVGWLDAGARLGVRSAGPAPVQVLRVVLLRH